ncbi:MAG: hypothetical protein FWG55_03560 [Candidatus Bathyarchaeota archaeon]|nr:hypothetical protein [Candidatus Termiticorpusculum sp.]
MYENEIQENNTCTCESKKTDFDVNVIINKIGDFANSIKEISEDNKPMMIRLDGLNFSINRQPNMYDLTVKLNLAIKPKPSSKTIILP